MRKNVYLFVLLLLLVFLLPKGICQVANGDSKTLEIALPQNMIEYEEVNITIISNGTPIPDAIVLIKNQESNYFSTNNIKKTDDNGIIAYKSPEIYSEAKSYFTIIVAKVGYITNETIIHITNLPNLHINFYPYGLKENDIFTATVKDDSQNLINNAEVSLWNENFTIMYTKNYTDENGEATFRVPPKQEEIMLKSTKTGYVYGQSSIFVSSPEPLINIDFNVLSFYLFFFTIFVVIPVAIFYLIFKNKSEKKK